MDRHNVESSNIFNESLNKDDEYSKLQKQFSEALCTVDDIVLKNYLSKLYNLKIVPLNDKVKNNALKDVRIFKITEIVYEKNEFSTYKFASVFNTLANVACTVFLIVDSDGEKANFYMGIRGYDDECEPIVLKEILKNSLKGQFPGIKTNDDYSLENLYDLFLKMQNDIKNISSVSCVANNKSNEIDENKFFLQGLEKFVLGMQGKKYTGVIIADSATKKIQKMKRDYETIYSQLMPVAKTQVTYTENNSFSKAVSDYFIASIYRKSDDGSKSDMPNDSVMNRENINNFVNSFKIFSRKNGGVLGVIGRVLSVLDSTESKGKNLTLNVENKYVSSIIGKLETQLKRIEDCESIGMWECSAYFMSEDNATAKIAALTYKSLMRGENSGVEVGVVNSWFSINNKDNVRLLKEYIFNIQHPVFEYKLNGQQLYLTAASMVSSNELAIHMGLPRKSVPGFPVIEHADFGKEVVKYNNLEIAKSINLGSVFNMGAVTQNKTVLDLQSLAMHTFITGATGSGKSNTVYKILEQLLRNEVKFMVIEPAKGEYKNVFGTSRYSDCYGVHVYGTNPAFADLLKINPFKFPKGIHVLEHVDRLVEIFNVCWPMYAAMPAVLKDAILQAYENAGWDLTTSENKVSYELFPTFKDLLIELVDVINKSAYDQEVKSNYIGSLQTRVKSLTNGLNGQIFSSNEIDNAILFDSNVVIDLSRIGSIETKALIMGILVMRLNEHRMTQTDGMNVALKHVTVLEEAHNILKRTSTEQSMESANMAGKSVEMLSNAIAEMRTYGEGFIIADQSPNAVDISAIRNTNTKIIMRLPDEDDRMLAGKAAALKDEQIDEIAKLPKGVAVVYQNDWLEAVLCKVDRFDGEEKLYNYTPKNDSSVEENKLKLDLIKFLINAEKLEYLDTDLKKIKTIISCTYIPTVIKREIYQVLYKKAKDKKLFSKVIVDLFGCREAVAQSIKLAKTTDELDLKLHNIIFDKSSDFSICETIEISKILMADYAFAMPAFEPHYKFWINHIDRKGRLV